MGFNLDDYEPVEVRIKKFYEQVPEGRITTELVSDCAQIESVAVFKSYAWCGDVCMSTGYAMEKFGAGYVNDTSHVENAETSAIGRALANMGLSGNKRPSREEMEHVERGQAHLEKRADEGRAKIKQMLLDYKAIFAAEDLDEIRAELEVADTFDKVTSLYRRFSAKVKVYEIESMKDEEPTAENMLATEGDLF